MKTYWTIQSAEKWNEAKKKGVLQADKEYIWPEFIEPYHWMMQKMSENFPNYGGEYPIWVWPVRPDLRRSGHLEKGERGVLLQIELADDQVLLSEFQAWHFVLMNEYCNISAKDDSELDLSEESIRDSWNLIFDLPYLSQHPDWGECTVQGVTREVNVNRIKLTKEFIAR